VVVPSGWDEAQVRFTPAGRIGDAAGVPL
jgi:hypothetical protein